MYKKEFWKIAKNCNFANLQKQKSTSIYIYFAETTKVFDEHIQQNFFIDILIIVSERFKILFAVYETF